MVYLIGTIGFIGGFLFGQLLLRHILHDRSREEIMKMMEDGGARLKYGVINWFFAVLGAVSFVWAYNRYFF